MPLVDAHTPRHVVKLPLQFGGRESFIDASAVKARHTALNVSFVGFEGAIGILREIAIGRFNFRERHRSLVQIGTWGMVVFEAQVPFQTIVPAIIVEQGDLVATACSGVVE